MDAIVNDAPAALLMRAYLHDSAQLALVLGTGLNAAMYIPVSALGCDKFGSRSEPSPQQATHVVVNAELSMFGKDIFPLTRWDVALNDMSMQPDFQPLEQLVGGRYLGEIVRLILVEAVQTAGLFASGVPEHLYEPYSLSTETMSIIETDTSSSLSVARAQFKVKPAGATYPDLRFVRHVCALVMKRAAAFVATALHALWTVTTVADGRPASSAGRLTIGCTGSVIEKYPGFKSAVQQYLDPLVEMSGGKPHSLTLELAVESAVSGAAVAIALAEAEGA